MVPDLANTSVLVIVWAMPGCGACDEYLPMFLKQVAAHQGHGAPFHVWRPGQALEPGQIPVLLYDAASEDEELQALADRLGVSATPTTCLLTRWTAQKVEGAISASDVDQLLYTAQRANR
jgi:hypothetical protein